MENLFVPNVSALQARNRGRIPNSQHRIGYGVILNVYLIFDQRRCQSIQSGTFGRNDRAFRFVILRGEQPELAMFNLELPAFFANAPFAQDYNLFATSQCVHHDSPLFEGDFRFRQHSQLIINVPAEDCPPANPHPIINSLVPGVYFGYKKSGPQFSL